MPSQRAACPAATFAMSMIPTFLTLLLGAAAGTPPGETQQPDTVEEGLEEPPEAEPNPWQTPVSEVPS